MNVVEELLAQRDAVLFGKWVKGVPQNENEACLIERCAPEHRALSGVANSIVRSCVVELYGSPYTFLWNDCYAKDKSEVIEVLDEAIRMAKEAGL